MEDKLVSDTELRRALGLVQNADRVLISAGAGLSVPAGNNYYDKAAFAQRFPGMLTHGYSYPYQLVGNQDLFSNKALMWGYFADYIHTIRFNLPLSEVYTKLLDFSKTKDSWIITTNADGLFERHGFDLSRIYTPQGDFKYLQCSKPCKPDSVFDSKPIVEKLLPHIDRATQLLKDVETNKPTCLHCGAELLPNVNGGRWYSPQRFLDAGQRLEEWIAEARSEDLRLTILEIGVGFNTPGVIRWPMEGLAYRHPNVSIIRINLEAPEVAEEIPQERRASLPMDALEFVRVLHSTLPQQTQDKGENTHGTG